MNNTPVSGDTPIFKLFQIKAGKNYTARTLIPASFNSSLFHLTKGDFELSEKNRQALAYSLDTYQMTEAQAAECVAIRAAEEKKEAESPKGPDGKPTYKAKKLYRIILDSGALVAQSIVFDFDGKDHVLDQPTLEAAKKLDSFLADSLGMVDGYNYVMHYTGCGGLHFVIPYWVTGFKPEAYNKHKAAAIAAHIAERAGVSDAYDKGVYDDGQIFKAAFSINTRSVEKFGVPVFSYPVSSADLRALSLSDFVEFGKKVEYQDVPTIQTSGVVSKLRDLLSGVKIPEVAPTSAPVPTRKTTASQAAESKKAGRPASVSVRYTCQCVEDFANNFDKLYADVSTVNRFSECFPFAICALNSGGENELYKFWRHIASIKYPEQNSDTQADEWVNKTKGSLSGKDHTCVCRALPNGDKQIGRAHV